MQSYRNPGQQSAYAAPVSNASAAAPYTAPGSQKASSGGGMAYFKKPVAILKIISVFFGLIAMSVSLHGYFNGLHFHETFNAKLCKKGENCSRHNYHEEEVCAYQNSLLEDYKNEFGQGQGPYFPTKYPKQACPSRWMVVPQVFIIASAWVGTLTVLIVLSTLDICNNKSFALFDMIGHLLAAGLTIVSGLCLIGYYIWATLRSEYKLCDSYSEFQGRAPASLIEEFQKICFNKFYKKFPLPHLLSGGIFALFTGFLYFVIAVLAFCGSGDGRSKFQNMGQRPMAPYQAPMQQAHPQPYQQQQYYGYNPQQFSSMPSSGSPSQAPVN